MKNKSYRESDAYKKAVQAAAEQNQEQSKRAKSYVDGDNPWGFSDRAIRKQELDFSKPSKRFFEEWSDDDNEQVRNDD